MKTVKNNGINHILTATNEDNDRQIEQMVGKAMCAYANWQQERNSDREDKIQKKLIEQSHRSEYEATVRCIGLFVDQPTSYICQYVIARAKEEFGI